MAKRAPRPEQATLPFRQHGGRRAGSGRKPKLGQPGVKHRQREVLPARFPTHVTMKLRSGLPRLRGKREYAVLRGAFTAGTMGKAQRARVVHYSIQNDHLHLLVEAQDRAILTRALQGLVIRIAKALNKLWNRRGTVFADRYHDRVLKTPREVRNALRYVLGNARKHAAEGREVAVPQAIDTFTSAPWFDGWQERISVRGLSGTPCPVASARTWLLRIGWQRHGLLSVHELPRHERPRTG